MKKWIVNPRTQLDVLTEDGRLIANCGGYQKNQGASKKLVEELKANTKFISMAPVMYNELSHLIKIIEPLLNDGLSIPGLATMNSAKYILDKADNKI